MEDTQMVELLVRREENAIDALQEKYGGLCRSVARHILSDDRDVEECVNDTFLRVWNAIPPECPDSLSAYLARITRNVALDRYAYNTAQKRNSVLTCAFEELEPYMPALGNQMEQLDDIREFTEFIRSFLRGISYESRVFFVRRYWYGQSIHEIAQSFHCGEGKVKTSLFRTRSKLRDTMVREKQKCFVKF